jgi:hypothetical protein
MMREDDIPLVLLCPRSAILWTKKVSCMTEWGAVGRHGLPLCESRLFPVPLPVLSCLDTPNEAPATFVLK